MTEPSKAASVPLTESERDAIRAAVREWTRCLRCDGTGYYLGLLRYERCWMCRA